ncbi:uncharacterized protein LOC126784258 [Argentina anserina]|uniref:uncharacterized protein LOC126784258 n=1 Tax=Argentina anserina TaxID=57926 RepID=UPI0021765A02|nr:uncharacterized protein LOC126784258 [Potentilla anserina]
MKQRKLICEGKISQLGDDLLGQIVKWVSDPEDRKRVSEVCKQWSTVEGLTRRSLTLLDLRFLRRVLPRFPNLVTFQTSQPISEEDDLLFVAQTCPKLEAINLTTKPGGYGVLPENGLSGLSTGGGLPRLSKVILRGRVNVSIEEWLHKLAPDHLTYLDLHYCGWVDDDAIEPIGLHCTCLSYLNLGYSDISDNCLKLLAHGKCSETLESLVLAGCADISDNGLRLLANISDDGLRLLANGRGLKTLKTLGLSGCSKISDDGLRWLAHGSFSKTLKTLELADCTEITESGLSHLQNMTCLEELDLNSTEVDDDGVIAAVSGNQSIKKLNLSWLYELSDQTLFFVADNCPKLEFLDISGADVTGAGIRALSGHKCLESFVWCTSETKFMSDLEHMVLGCQSLKSIVLSKHPMNLIPDCVSRIATYEFFDDEDDST